MKTKKLNTKLKFKQQLAWFVGIYLASVLALGIFHQFSKWLIAILK